MSSTKVKCKLYTESSNQSDVNGGIWLYNSIFWNDHYNNKALNIILESELYADGSDNRGLEGESGLGTSGNGLNVRNFYYHRNGGTGFALTLVHEIGHRLGLNHPEWCNNECAGIDIDPIVECSTNCPQVGQCSPSQYANNGGKKACVINGDTFNLCRSSCDRSNLLTSACFRSPKAMTPCQWEVIFNDVKSNNPLYALLCYTTSIFTLPQSPLNDYRASQSITSTSVLQGDRQVDYWSPTITLNPGFEVQQGTAFLAAPSTFPCCTGSGNGGGNAISDNNSDTPINKIKDVLLVTPNPFNESVKIDYEVNQDFENVDMSLVDINGRILKNIQTESKNKGHYQVQVKTNDLPNGVYFIRYKSQYKIAIQKVIKSASN